MYQRTVTELEVMGGVFWLVFVPLARDVDTDKLKRVLERVRQEIPAVNPACREEIAGGSIPTACFATYVNVAWVALCHT